MSGVLTGLCLYTCQKICHSVCYKLWPQLSQEWLNWTDVHRHTIHRWVWHKVQEVSIRCFPVSFCSFLHSGVCYRPEKSLVIIYLLCGNWKLYQTANVSNIILSVFDSIQFRKKIIKLNCFSKKKFDIESTASIRCMTMNRRRLLWCHRNRKF